MHANSTQSSDPLQTLLTLLSQTPQQPPAPQPVTLQSLLQTLSSNSQSTAPITDVLGISPQVIQEVRLEYEAQQRSEKLHNARESGGDTIAELAGGKHGLTSEVLREIERIVRDKKIMDMVKGLMNKQAQLEKKLFEKREMEVKRLDVQKNELFAREITGESTPQDVKNFDLQATRELRMFDEYIVNTLDIEAAWQQEQLGKLGIPLFYVTKDPKIIEQQLSVLGRLLEIIPQ